MDLPHTQGQSFPVENRKGKSKLVLSGFVYCSGVLNLWHETFLVQNENSYKPLS